MPRDLQLVTSQICTILLLKHKQNITPLDMYYKHAYLKFYFIYFYLYIYPPDSQESAGGAIHRVSNYPDLLPEMPRYCCPLEI